MSSDELPPPPSYKDSEFYPSDQDSDIEKGNTARSQINNNISITPTCMEQLPSISSVTPNDELRGSNGNSRARCSQGYRCDNDDSSLEGAVAPCSGIKNINNLGRVRGNRPLSDSSNMSDVNIDPMVSDGWKRNSLLLPEGFRAPRGPDECISPSEHDSSSSFPDPPSPFRSQSPIPQEEPEKNSRMQHEKTLIIPPPRLSPFMDTETESSDNDDSPLLQEHLNPTKRQSPPDSVSGDIRFVSPDLRKNNQRSRDNLSDVSARQKDKDVRLPLLSIRMDSFDNPSGRSSPVKVYPSRESVKATRSFGEASDDTNNIGSPDSPYYRDAFDRNAFYFPEQTSVKTANGNEDLTAVDTMPPTQQQKSAPKSKKKRKFRSTNKNYPICLAVSFTTMLCMNPPVGVVAVFLSYLAWKAFDRDDEKTGQVLANFAFYVSIAGILTTMILVITLLYQTTIGF
ncbi:uncharacterized protein LOC141915438 [Tubulanus polymorphus]|uniref:uncharacterized protein LOC141915438 n=1 Tax=Tubulanus polymorphus TaxID=672921 RepID=UPI003DA45988